MTKQFDEGAFNKQLSIFQDAMVTDLNKRNSDVGKKWEFDFEMGEPFEQSKLEQTQQETRPTMLPV